MARRYQRMLLNGLDNLDPNRSNPMFSESPYTQEGYRRSDNPLLPNPYDPIGTQTYQAQIDTNNLQQKQAALGLSDPEAPWYSKAWGKLQDLGKWGMSSPVGRTLIWGMNQIDRIPNALEGVLEESRDQALSQNRALSVGEGLSSAFRGAKQGFLHEKDYNFGRWLEKLSPEAEGKEGNDGFNTLWQDTVRARPFRPVAEALGLAKPAPWSPDDITSLRGKSGPQENPEYSGLANMTVGDIMGLLFNAKATVTPKLGRIKVPGEVNAAGEAGEATLRRALQVDVMGKHFTPFQPQQLKAFDAMGEGAKKALSYSPTAERFLSHFSNKVESSATKGASKAFDVLDNSRQGYRVANINFDDRMMEVMKSVPRGTLNDAEKRLAYFAAVTGRNASDAELLQAVAEAYSIPLMDLQAAAPSAQRFADWWKTEAGQFKQIGEEKAILKGIEQDYAPIRYNKPDQPLNIPDENTLLSNQFEGLKGIQKTRTFDPVNGWQDLVKDGASGKLAFDRLDEAARYYSRVFHGLEQRRNILDGLEQLGLVSKEYKEGYKPLGDLLKINMPEGEIPAGMGPVSRPLAPKMPSTKNDLTKIQLKDGAILDLGKVEKPDIPHVTMPDFDHIEGPLFYSNGRTILQLADKNRVTGSTLTLSNGLQIKPKRFTGVENIVTADGEIVANMKQMLDDFQAQVEQRQLRVEEFYNNRKVQANSSQPSPQSIIDEALTPPESVPRGTPIPGGGEESIKNVFGQPYFINERYAPRFIDELFGYGGGGGVNPLLRGLSKIQDPWKMLVTTFSPGYHIKNMNDDIARNFYFGDVAADDLRMAMLPSEAQVGERMVRDWSLRNGQWVYTPGSREVMNLSEKQAVNLGRAMGVSTVQTTEEIGKFTGKPQTFGQKVRKGMDSFREKTERLQGSQREANFLANFRNMEDSGLAKQITDADLINYRDISPFMRDIVKPFAPFSTFRLKNPGVSLNQMLMNPKKMSYLYRAQQGVQETHGTEEGEKNLNLPSYYRDKPVFAWNNPEENLLRVVDLGLSQFDAQNLVPGERLTETLRRLPGPAVQLPLGLITGKDTRGADVASPKDSRWLDGLLFGQRREDGSMQTPGRAQFIIDNLLGEVADYYRPGESAGQAINREVTEKLLGQTFAMDEQAIRMMIEQNRLRQSQLDKLAELGIPIPSMTQLRTRNPNPMFR